MPTFYFGWLQWLEKEKVSGRRWSKVPAHDHHAIAIAIKWNPFASYRRFWVSSSAFSTNYSSKTFTHAAYSSKTMLIHMLLQGHWIFWMNMQSRGFLVPHIPLIYRRLSTSGTLSANALGLYSLSMSYGWSWSMLGTTYPLWQKWTDWKCSSMHSSSQDYKRWCDTLLIECSIHFF